MYVRCHRRVLRALVVGLVTAVLTASCGGSEEPAPAPEIGLLKTAFDQLESTPGAVQGCAELMTALSRDLDGGVITDDVTLESRRDETSSCFTTVRTQIQEAGVPLREILELNGVSEATDYTSQQVSDMAGPVAAAYALIHIGSGLDEQIGRATSLVDGARLGVPLGASSISELLEEEPVETVNVLLFLDQRQKVFEDTIGLTRDLLADSASGG